MSVVELFLNGAVRALNPLQFDQPLQQKMIEAAYHLRHERYCLCADPAIPFTIRRISDPDGIDGFRYILARLPGTYEHHSAGCWFRRNEPNELDPIDAHPAIKVGRDDGVLQISVETPLSSKRLAVKKEPGRPVPNASDESAAAGGERRSKLPLLGAILFLWDQAGLTTWPPKDGAIHWNLVRQRFMAKAEIAKFGKDKLAEHLYMPSIFVPEKAEKYEGFWKAYLKSKIPDEQGHHRGWVLTELKGLRPLGTGFWSALDLKQMPFASITIDQTLWGQTKAFYPEAAQLLEDGEADLKVMALLQFKAGQRGYLNVTSLLLFLTTPKWLPVLSRGGLEQLPTGEGWSYRLRLNLETCCLSEVVVENHDFDLAHAQDDIEEKEGV